MVQEISTQSWGSRIGGTFAGVLFGILLIIGAFFLIFWNEGKALHTAQSLQQAQQVLITVPNAPINDQNNLRVIYFTGDATTEDVLEDPLFNISEKAIKLERKIEMYQWQENVETKKEKEMGGSEKEIKNYTYSKTWSSSLIDSSTFKEQTGHENPAELLIKPREKYATTVTVGDFHLPTELIKKIGGATVYDLSKTEMSELQTKVKKPITPTDEGIYIGENSQIPAVGDMKVSEFIINIPQTVSIIGQQTTDTVQAYVAPAGESVLLLETGKSSPEVMIQNALDENQLMTWILRICSLVMMMIGVSLILKPFAILADFLPFLGSIVEFGTGIIAFILGLFLWGIGIAIAWVTVRPLWAVGFILGIAVICYWLFVIRKKKAKASQP